ncbi:MAG: DUF1007 family protein [Arcobacter sp.]|uniref:DUF1007 family protein n=1 Tax=Arcobacter sp. TaxID=1872629 RepID=UPI003D02E873
MKKKLALFFCGLNLYAHPHYFLDSSLQIDENIVKNFWKFDALNSKILMFDFDKNKNKILDKDEKEEFLKANFYKLKANNYNIFLQNEEKEFEIIPQNVDVIYENRKLTIYFDFPYELKGETTFCTMDEKIYLAYKLEDLKTNLKTDIQKSEYDYCIGVTK